MQEWFKVNTAAQYLDMSPRTIRDLLKKGLRHSRLPSSNGGGTILIKKEWIDEFMAGFEAKDNQVDSIVSDVLKGMA